MPSESPAPQPPELPEMPRRVHLDLPHALAVLLIALLPILAVAGVLNEATATVQARTDRWALEVRYPSRLPYTVERSLQAHIRNPSGETLRNVRVAVDRDYLDGFDDVSVEPAEVLITGDHYVVQIGEIPPGETRRVDIRLRGHAPWRRRGSLTAEAEGAPPLSVGIVTWVLP